MKLAEALLHRSELSKRLISLRDRLESSVFVQEGDEPPEEPLALLAEARRVMARQLELIVKVNKANLRGRTASKRTLTEAIAERDVLTAEHSLLQTAIKHAAQSSPRYSAKEIRWVRKVDVADLQSQLDKAAQKLREVNVEIQAANWKIELE